MNLPLRELPRCLNRTSFFTKKLENWKNINTPQFMMSWAIAKLISVDHAICTLLRAGICCRIGVVLLKKLCLISLILVGYCEFARAQTNAAIFDSAGIKNAGSGDYVEAIANFTRAIELDPKYASAYVNRGLVKINLKDYTGAINDSTTAIGLNPQSPMGYNNRGLAKFNLSNYGDAISDYSKAIELNPQYFNAYNNRALAKLNSKTYSEAIQDATKAIELNSLNVNPYITRGDARNSLKYYNDAIVDYTKAIELDSKNANVFNNRGSAKAGLEDFNGAIADFTMAIRLMPDAPAPYLNRGKAEFSLKKNYTIAISDINKAIELGLSSAEAYAVLGYIQNDLFQFEAALKSFLISLNLDSSQDYCRFRICLIRSRVGQQEKATQELAGYLRSLTDTAKAKWPIPIGQFLIGALTEADFLGMAKGSSAYPKDQNGHLCEAYYYIGMKHLVASDKTNAAEFFQKCLDTGEKQYFEYGSAQAELHVREN